MTSPSIRSLKSSDPLVLVLALDRLASRKQLRKDFTSIIEKLVYRTLDPRIAEGLQRLRLDPSLTLFKAANGDKRLMNRLSYHRNRLGIGKVSL